MNVRYNEIDPVAAACIVELASEGVIPSGRVDTRSIKELTPDDLHSVTQFHAFAGAGAWAYAARLAGWGDRPLWTGSCPCQPFSQAGKRAGAADERHLWPDFFRLIRACRPGIVVGEQVAGAAGYDWFDGVASDLEQEGYEARAIDIPAAAVDAPHIRQRLYWVAMADADAGRRAGREKDTERGEIERAAAERADDGSHLADAGGQGLEVGSFTDDGSGIVRSEGPAAFPDDAQCGDVGNAASDGRQQGESRSSIARYGDQSSPAYGGNGSFWSDAEWLTCHDGKARRTKPELRLLADGVRSRVHQWRVAGNSIVLPLAEEFLKAVKETLT